MSATTSRVEIPKRREEDLWQRFHRNRDQRTREELVVLYMPFAKRIASRYAGVSEPFDDLMQVANLGLVNAVDRYDAERGVPFLGFASPTIQGELKRYFRDKVWTVRVPRSVHDNLSRIERAITDLGTKFGRPPSVAEIAERIEAEPDDVLEALEAKHNRRPVPLDRPPSWNDEGDVQGPEWLGDDDAGYGLVDDRLSIEAALPDLSETERRVLSLRFVDDLSQSEIGARIGCSQMHVSRILRRSLERIREHVGERIEEPVG